MRYERKEVFVDRHIIIETEEERVKFNKMIADACIEYATGNPEMWEFVNGIRSGN